MSELCKWLVETLAPLPLVEYPFNRETLPAESVIYCFYETGEIWGHGGVASRLVRIGTSDHLRRRICEHFLLDESKMNFDATKPAPRERSIFRKHVGGTLLNRRSDPYLKVWE